MEGPNTAKGFVWRLGTCGYLGRAQEAPDVPVWLILGAELGLVPLVAVFPLDEVLVCQQAVMGCSSTCCHCRSLALQHEGIRWNCNSKRTHVPGASTQYTPAASSWHTANGSTVRAVITYILVNLHRSSPNGDG